MPFFANSREGPPRAKLRKKTAGDQLVDNNTYTPNAVASPVQKSPLPRRISSASLSKASLPGPPTALSQLTRTTRTLMNIRNHSAPMVLDIGKPKFVKRNDSPIHRFPSQKEELLIEGIEKLVQLKGDVVPGPGVKPMENAPEPEPETVEEEPKKILKVINLPDADVKPAFQEIRRLPSPPLKPLPLAAGKPPPLRRESLPVEGKTQNQPLPTVPLVQAKPAQGYRGPPNYRGVAAFRFGGSIPGPSAAPKDSRALPGLPTRANTVKHPAIKVIPASPLSQEINPNSPPLTNRHLGVSQGLQGGHERNHMAGGASRNQGSTEYHKDARMQRRDSLKNLARAAEARNMMATRSEFEKLQQQNIELHNRLQAFEANTLSDNRLLLNRIITIEKTNLAIQQSQVINMQGSFKADTYVDESNDLLAFQQQIVLLQQANDELTAQVEHLKQEKEELIRNSEAVEHEDTRAAESNTKAKEADQNLRIIEALETQNSIDRKKAREEKENLEQKAKASQEKHIEEITTLHKRITTLETECAQHIQELQLSKDEKLSRSVKENETLQKEIKVLWTEISDISKQVESGNAKKITDLESELAAAKAELANDAVIKENLKKEITVLWGEIKDLLEKQTSKSNISRSIYSPSFSESGKNNQSIIPAASEASQPQSPQTEIPDIASPIGVLEIQQPLRRGRPSTPIPQRENLNQPDLIKSPEGIYGRRQGSTSSVRFRPGAAIPTEDAPSVKHSKLPLPTAPPAINGARFGYGPRKKRAPLKAGSGAMAKASPVPARAPMLVRAPTPTPARAPTPGRSWKPPGTSLPKPGN